jgi:hypothetical protein
MKGTLLAGRYRIDEEIGRGGMATVYRAFDRSLERPVAVKVLRPELAADETIVARFRAEAQAAARLSHPNIVQIYDTGEHDGLHFLVMEYLPEPDLKTVIRDYAPLPAHKVAEVAIQACEALGYAHQHGLIHRDVKPHNILFSADGRAKLADFGIAAAIGEGSEGAVLLGSAHYLSPEEVHGNAPTPQSDLYSLGVVMYECLAGRTPFQGDTAEAVISKRLGGPPPAPRSVNPSIPPAAEHVVLHAMARDANQRYQSAGEMLADLRRLAAGAPMREPLVPTGEATQTIVLSRPPEPVSSAPLREVAPGPREPPPAPKSQGGTNWIWGVGGFLAGVVALVALVLLFKYLFYGGQGAAYVLVPGVTGLSREQARLSLVEAGLALGRVREEETETAPPGTVAEQQPEAGARVPKGSDVDLVIAAAGLPEKKVVKVIQVVGLPVADAEANLRAIGLQVGKVEEVFDDEAPTGDVVKQSIEAGTEVGEGQSVDLWVSKGPEPPAVESGEDVGEPTGAPLPDEGEEEAEMNDPLVEVEEDPSHAPDDPTKRKFTIRVWVQGKRSGQAIEIVVRDERQTRNVVYQGVHDPMDVIRKSVTTTGPPTIEVYRDGTLVATWVPPPIEPTP